MKVKIAKSKLLNALAEFSLLQSYKDYIHFSFDDNHVPDFIELEGEAVEKTDKRTLLCKKGKHEDCSGGFVGCECECHQPLPPLPEELDNKLWSLEEAAMKLNKVIRYLKARE